MKKLYEIRQPLYGTRWIRVEAESEEEALELAEHENFWHETEMEKDGAPEVEEIQELPADL